MACTLYDLYSHAFPEATGFVGRGSLHPWAFVMAFVVVSGEPSLILYTNRCLTPSVRSTLVRLILQLE